MDNKTANNLIEPGVKYFFYESLKQCKIKKTLYFNTILNLGLLFLFISIFGILIIYKKNTKITKKEKAKRNLMNQNYILEKVKMLNKEKQKQSNLIITNLPTTFESTFEKMHKNYYSI
jgi:hypothetical protein|tara:strand:+ start:700 stop:1053 length:354 start_codon:yes stop_codon:yes gene_type:complete